MKINDLILTSLMGTYFMKIKFAILNNINKFYKKRDVIFTLIF